jgi:fatty-acyl-CoA synthase
MRNHGTGAWIARRARISPRRTALIYQDRAWTYAALAQDISLLAGRFARAGVRPGDRLGYLGQNHPGFFQTFFAAGLLGAVFVPLNGALAVPELEYIITDAGCSLIVYGPDALEYVTDLRGMTTVRDWVPAHPEPGPPQPDATGSHEETVDLPVGLGDLCTIIYTSGTTGRPKGVMLSHGNVTWNALNYLSIADFRQDDVTLAVAPLYRAGGWGVTLLPTLQKGGAVVLMSGFDARGAIDLIEEHRVTTLFAGPTVLAALARSPTWPDADLASLRFVISGGDVVPESLIHAYHRRGIPFLQGYGLTEAGPMALMLDESDAVRKLGSAGLPPLFVDVRIGRPDLSDAEPEEVGEILVRGPNVMQGYWRRPEETEAALPQGWLRTGDAGWTDEEGYVYVVDRLKDRFVSRGENVYPGEVERVLAEHAAVAEAAVVAAEDEAAGHVGVAWVVLTGDAAVAAEDLLAHCRRRLAPFKVPAEVHFLDVLPRNAAGKLLRQRLIA